MAATEPMTLVQLWLQADGISLFLHLQSVELHETKLYRFSFRSLIKEKSDFHKDHNLGAPIDFNQWLEFWKKSLGSGLCSTVQEVRPSAPFPCV